MASGENNEGDTAPTVDSEASTSLTLPRKLGRATLYAVPWLVVGGVEALEFAAGNPNAGAELPANISLAAFTNLLTRILVRNW